MKDTYKFFKFLEDRKEKKIPFLAKLIHAPETLTKEDLYVKGNLDLSSRVIKSLPRGLKVEGDLNLTYSSIQSLPEGLRVGGYLVLTGTSIQSLPEGLKVGGSLFLSYSSIRSLPEGLIVGGNLHIFNTPLSKKYTEKEIRKMIEETGGYIQGRIVL